MRPNGTGKSTLSETIMGNPRYYITEGDILLNDESIINMPVDERARKGLFLAMQYPAEVPGVSNAEFLRATINARRPKNNLISIMDFLKELDKNLDLLDMKDIFITFSSKLNYFGSYGSGQHAKMANQIMIAGTMTGMTEMLVYAKAAGLNLKQICQTLQSGIAENFSLGTYGPRILKGDYTPGFFAKHFLKDLRIALKEAEKMNLDLPATREAKRLYETLVDDQKLGDDGTQALIKLWWK